MDDEMGIEVAWQSLFAERSAAEADLISALLANFEGHAPNPRPLLEAAINAGILSESFGCDDLRIIFDTLDHLSTSSQTRLSQIEAIYTALADGGYFDDPENPLRWPGILTPESLGVLFKSWFYSPAAVADLSHKLIAIVKRYRRFFEYINSALALAEKPKKRAK